MKSQISMRNSVAIALCLLLALAGTLPAASFEILFPLSNQHEIHRDVFVSDDGSRVVATSVQHTTYLWEENQGITTVWNDLSDRTGMSGDGQTILTYTYASSFHPTDASFDGSVISGNFSSGFPASRPVGIINGQTVELGKVFPDDTNGSAEAVSADGSTIVGSSYVYVPGLNGEITRSMPFRWTADTGMISLGVLPNASRPHANATDVSGDGSVIVGRSSIANNKWEAFRWTEATGMQGLGDLPGGHLDSNAFAISANGQVIVGSSYAETQIPGTFMHDLLPEAFIWTEASGMHDLRELLINDYQLDLDDYRLRAATGVSRQGNIIVGVGTGSQGSFAWRVNLVPEPTALVQLAAIAVCSFATRRRRFFNR